MISKNVIEKRNAENEMESWLSGKKLYCAVIEQSCMLNVGHLHINLLYGQDIDINLTVTVAFTLYLPILLNATPIMGWYPKLHDYINI